MGDLGDTGGEPCDGLPAECRTDQLAQLTMAWWVGLRQVSRAELLPEREYAAYIGGEHLWIGEYSGSRRRSGIRARRRPYPNAAKLDTEP